VRIQRGTVDRIVVTVIVMFDELPSAARWRL
jgi:hypothetical protein